MLRLNSFFRNGVIITDMTNVLTLSVEIWILSGDKFLVNLARCLRIWFLMRLAIVFDVELA